MDWGLSPQRDGPQSIANPSLRRRPAGWGIGVYPSEHVFFASSDRPRCPSCTPRRYQAAGSSA